MAKIDVELFTNEIEKTYTILKQNLVMIDTIKQLIAQGNLSEDAIATLQTGIERTNEMINGLETALDKTNNTIEDMNKVIPTDINVDSDSKLILEHDGVEITGQKKNLIPIIADSIDDDGYNITKGIYSAQPIKTEQDIWVDRVRIYSNVEQDDQVTVSFNVDDIQTYTQLQFDSHSSGGYILQNNNVKTFFGNQSIYGYGNIDLYRHRLKITPQGQGSLTGEIYSSSNINVSSNSGATQKLVTLLKCTSGYYGTFIGSLNDHGRLLYQNNTLQIETNSGLFTIATIEDTVETI